MIFYIKKIIFVYIIVFSIIQAETKLAKVGNKIITIKSINQYLQIAAPGVKYSNLSVQEKKLVLKQMIDRNLILELAKKDKIQKTKKFKKEFSFIKQNFTIDFLMRERASSIKIPLKTVQEYFKNNKNNFIQPAQYLVSHILVKTKKEAKSILLRLKKTKQENLSKKFKQFAKLYSIGPSKNNDGSIGWVKNNDMLPPFSKEVQKTQKGTIANNTVKTTFGYHIIYLLDTKDEQKIGFDSIKDKLTEALVVDQLKKDLSKEIEQIKKFISIDIY